VWRGAQLKTTGLSPQTNSRKGNGPILPGRDAAPKKNLETIFTPSARTPYDETSGKKPAGALTKIAKSAHCLNRQFGQIVQPNGVGGSPRSMRVASIAESHIAHSSLPFEGVPASPTPG
jgi:hypothetical protein